MYRQWVRRGYSFSLTSVYLTHNSQNNRALPCTYTGLVPRLMCLRAHPYPFSFQIQVLTWVTFPPAQGKIPARSGREVTRGTRWTQESLCANADTTGTSVCICLCVSFVYWCHLTLLCIGCCCREIVLFSFLRLTSFFPSHFFTALCTNCRNSNHPPIPQAPEREIPTSLNPGDD